MSILGFLLKSKNKMVQKNAKHVRVWKYTITSHAQNRIADNARRVDKMDVLDNLFTKPNVKTSVKFDDFHRPSYNRIGKRITISINPENNYVVSCRPVSEREIKQYALNDIGKGGKKKYVKRTAKKRIHSKSQTSGKNNT